MGLLPASCPLILGAGCGHLLRTFWLIGKVFLSVGNGLPEGCKGACEYGLVTHQSAAIHL